MSITQDELATQVKVKVIDYEKEVDGKGKCVEIVGKGCAEKDQHLVYFRLDGSYNRSRVARNYSLTLTTNEIMGYAPGYFKDK